MKDKEFKKNKEDINLYPCPICAIPNITFCSVKYFVKGK